MNTKANQGIYALLIVSQNKRYVGSSGNIIARWERDHLPALRRNKHNNEALQSAFNDYGEANIRLVALEEISDATLLPERERFWICHNMELGLSVNKSRS